MDTFNDIALLAVRGFIANYRAPKEDETYIDYVDSIVNDLQSLSINAQDMEPEE